MIRALALFALFGIAAAADPCAAHTTAPTKQDCSSDQVCMTLTTESSGTVTFTTVTGSCTTEAACNLLKDASTNGQSTTVNGETVKATYACSAAAASCDVGTKCSP